jgi:hypothetical protein
MVEIGMPDAYIDPTILPPLVPAMYEMGMPASTRALMTPTWVTDFAVPPLNASPREGFFIGSPAQNCNPRGHGGV